jgi:hypothetical protein
VSTRWHELHREGRSEGATVTEALALDGGVLLAVRKFKTRYDETNQCWIFDRKELLYETVLFLPKAILDTSSWSRPARIVT